MPVHTIRFRSRSSGVRRALKWAAVALLALIALFLLAAAALAAFGGNWLRGPAERAVQEKTGRALKIDGDVKIRPGWPLLRVEASRIAFANADWAKHPDMAKVGDVDLAVSLPQLLIGRVVVDELRVRNADVALEKDAQGRKNWELPGGPSRVKIQRIALDNGRIDYEEPSRHTSLHAQIAAEPEGLAFSAQGSFEGEAVEAHGSGGPLLTVHDESRPYPFDVTARIGSLHASAKGSVTGLANLTAVDAGTEVHGDNLGALRALVGAPLPQTPAYRAAGRVVHEGNVWRYEKFELHLGDSDASGTVAMDTSGPRPKLSGEIVSDRINIADLYTAPGAGAQRTRLLPDEPIDAKRLGRVDADLRLSAHRIVPPHAAPLEGFAARLRLQDAQLTVDPIEFGVAGGRVSGTLALDGRKNPVHGKVKIKIAKVAPDRLIPGFDAPQIDPGRIDGAVELSGSGGSMAQLLGNADGSVAMLVAGGHVSRLLMEEIGLHIPRIVALKAGGDRPIAIRCAAADFKVDNGIMHTQTGVFDTTVTRVDAGGDINLRDETLDLTLNPNTKETSIFSLRTPIHIRGSFTKPDIQLEKGPIAAKSAGAAALAVANPLLALLPLIEAGPGRDSDCGRLLTASPAAEDVKKVPPAKSQGKGAAEK